MNRPPPRSLDIETLLQWAFRDELPKQRIEGTWGYSVSPMFRLAALGVRIDEFSTEPGFPNALGACHPDAETIGLAVEALEDVGIDWPGSRPHIMGDLAALVPEDDVTLSALVVCRAGLVGMHARMGTRPRLLADPEPEPIVGSNGKPIVCYLDDRGRVVEGRTRSRHYGTAARSPLRWFPVPREIAFARIEYLIWHEALGELAAVLNGRMTERVALPPSAPAAPWKDRKA